MDDRADHLDVSVALATRNGARYLEEQLTSILDQTVRPVQIVLSDDDSTDDTVAIARRIVGDAIPLTVLVNRPALGVTANFAQAVSACTAPLIALCDQDDRWRPDRLETLIAVFRARPEVLLVHSDARLVDGAGVDLGQTLLGALELSRADRDLIHAGEAATVLLRRSVVTGATTVFRRSLLDAALPFPAGWVHDEWLATLACLTGTIELVEHPLIDYRQHGANEIGARRPGLVQKIRKVLAEPRAARNARLEANYGALVERVTALGASVPGDLAERVSAKHAHEVGRAALPASRVRRLSPVFREARRGGYRDYGHGWQDVLRDLLQPAR